MKRLYNDGSDDFVGANFFNVAKIQYNSIEFLTIVDNYEL